MCYRPEISAAQRMNRIGELLAKGVALLLIKEAEQKRHIVQGPATPSRANGGDESANASGDNGGSADTENSVLEYLSRVREASPGEIQSALGLTRSTAYRTIDRLGEKGVVLRTGKTRSVRYRLYSGVKQMNQNLKAENGQAYDK